MDSQTVSRLWRREEPSVSVGNRTKAPRLSSPVALQSLHRLSYLGFLVSLLFPQNTILLMFRVSTDSSLQIADPFSRISVTLRCTGIYLIYGHCPEPHTLQYRHTVSYRTGYLSSNACDLYSAAISAADWPPSLSVRLSWFTQALDIIQGYS